MIGRPDTGRTHIVNALIIMTDIQLPERTMDPLVLLRQHEPELKKRFGVATIGIFGSYVRGEERPESDVDVLVTFRKGEKTFDNYMDCKFYLEDLFGRKVDLVMKGAIKNGSNPSFSGRSCMHRTTLHFLDDIGEACGNIHQDPWKTINKEKGIIS